MPSDFAASVARVFEGRVFHVPDYQRGYAWDAANWQDLIDDLDLLEPGKDHYYCDIVVPSRPDASPLVAMSSALASASSRRWSAYFA